LTEKRYMNTLLYWLWCHSKIQHYIYCKLNGYAQFLA